MTTKHDPGLSLGEYAYLELLERLLTLKIRPGEALSEDKLAAELATGVTPIRRAISRLAQEGLLRVYPRRATIAEEVHINDVQHLWEIRAPLEDAAAFYAAQRASAEHRAALEDLARQLEDQPTEASDIMQLHRRIHETVAAASMNPYLADRMAKLLNLTMRCWHLLHESGTLEHHDLRPHHLPLITAILDRDPDGAVAASRYHFEASGTSTHVQRPDLPNYGRSAEIRAMTDEGAPQ